MKIYLDNACTSFPKPKSVPIAMADYIANAGVNIGRGCYGEAYDAEAKVYETRQLLCSLFGGDDPKNVVFTKNVTESINILLKGFLKPGDHVLVSSMEHNAVMRPLVQLKERGIFFSRIPCDNEGNLILSETENLICPETKLIIMTHASNVSGSIMPIDKIGKICQKHGLKLFVDSAQSAGALPIDMEEMHIDALAFTGHKGLMGPQGIGGFILKEEMVNLIEPLISGGTGSISHTEDIPSFMPDRFEAGTLNIPGIIGLREGLLFIKNTGTAAIREKEATLTKRFLDKIKALPSVKIAGPKDILNRCSVVSLQIDGKDSALISDALDTEYGIMTRVGLHCAPSAHKTLGTYPEGTIRFSFGYFNTEEETDAAIRALEKLSKS